MSGKSGKERIIQAYAKLLGEQPAEEILLKQVLSRAEVSRPTFYYHFRSIDDLAPYLMEVFLEDLQHSFESLHSDERVTQGLVDSYLVLYEVVASKGAILKALLHSDVRDEFERRIIEYYNEVVRVTFGGNLPEARKHARLFLMPGNDHSFSNGFDGIGPSLADSIIALMRWVEEGIAPDTMPAEHYEVATGEVDRTGEVSVW